MAYERREFSGTAVVTTLSAPIDDNDTSFVLTSASGWPDGSGGDFFARIASETIRCASRSGTTVTVASSGRGADGTTAVAHATTDAVSHAATSIDFDEANEAVNYLLGEGSEWTDWTPSWTNLSVGNGTLVARYKQQGKTVHLQLDLTFGSTTSVTGTPSYTLPVACMTTHSQVGAVLMLDESAVLRFIGATRARALFPTTAEIVTSGGSISASHPFTWAVDDFLTASLTYEVP